ncbi:hypothetical protein H0H81_003904 [Sphagnurus paluster]|uniref:Uncharacterized protein n=1 Tax=Sphagnurus paluster TaxID=117069 RepID=A0A9P7FWK3_9AGAR|nr:hypothetical protein H0H81_003904 [Sphagnurus paluster]
MLWTPARSSAVARSIQKLLPNSLPPSLVARPGNLYEVISRTPDGGVGRKVHQIRWSEKQIGDSYWLVTRSKFKCEGKHGKAWGLLYWKNKLVSPLEQRIPGSLKYTWKEGPSVSKNTLKLVYSKPADSITQAS